MCHWARRACALHQTLLSCNKIFLRTLGLNASEPPVLMPCRRWKGGTLPREREEIKGLTPAALVLVVERHETWVEDKLEW